MASGWRVESTKTKKLRYSRGASYSAEWNNYTFNHDVQEICSEPEISWQLPSYPNVIYNTEFVHDF